MVEYNSLCTCACKKLAPPDSAASHRNSRFSHLTESREGNGMGENVVKSKERKM